jgi:hypothetical protein
MQRKFDAISTAGVELHTQRLVEETKRNKGITMNIFSEGFV